MNRSQLYDYLVKTNSKQYNLIKFIEESSELNELLTKSITKDGTPKQPSRKSIIDEIGDLEIRLNILKRIYGRSGINDRVKYKTRKYKSYINKRLYVGRI